MVVLEDGERPGLLPSLHNGFGDLVPISGFELQARQDVTPLLAELARTVMDCLRNGLGKRSCVSLPPDLGKTPADPNAFGAL